MHRLYIHKTKNGDYRYRGDAEHARHWSSRVAAEGYCVLYEQYPPTLNQLPGWPRVICRGFEVEERAPNQFAISFEVSDADLVGAVRSSEPW